MTTGTKRKPRVRANGEGTIFRRSDGRFAAQWFDEDGKRHTVYGKRRADVEMKLQAERTNRAKGLPVLDDSISTSDFLVDWLGNVDRRVRQSTWKKYDSLLRNHAIPHLHRIQLRRLTGKDLDNVYKRAVENGLSHSSANALHQATHSALADALRKHLVHRNVADEAEPFRARRPEMKTLTIEEVKLFLRTAAKDRLEPLYVLALNTGMRQGEILGLKWRDVNLNTGVIQINGTLQRGAGAIVAEPKTPRSRRAISLSSLALDALRRQRSIVPDDCEWVFPTASLKPWDSRNLVRREFEPMLSKAGVPKIRFHDLRHTFCTIALQLGENPKIVSEMAGHSSVGITLDLYSHVLPGMHQATAQRIGAALAYSEH